MVSKLEDLRAERDTLAMNYDELKAENDSLVSNLVANLATALAVVERRRDELKAERDRFSSRLDSCLEALKAVMRVSFSQDGAFQIAEKAWKNSCLREAPPTPPPLLDESS